jgi:hypothetical protein
MTATARWWPLGLSHCAGDRVLSHRGVIGRGLLSDDQRELLDGRIESAVDEAMA